ncbi:probable maltase-glucoamylase 2 [Talpa occidentalis]|uniref:probable maltase-glucoamylase 2 n=1 Tax=Talpa occidentalis TaxID=50954 RepID=UPI0023F8B828|nr:probable maltase-glucoamylase 2 [Talpa occidentalis]
MAKKLSLLEILLLVFNLLILAVDILLLLFLLNPLGTSLTPECPNNLPESDRIECVPGGVVTEEVCVGMYKCCWAPVANINVPSCFFPTNWGYEVRNRQKNVSAQYVAQLKRLPTPLIFGNDSIDALFTAENQTARRFHFKITDAKNRRYEVPHGNIMPFNGTAETDNKSYDWQVNDKPFSLKVVRKSNNKVLLDSSIGPLLFTNQYLQLSFRLPNVSVYGLGEHVHGQYRHSMAWKTWPIFTRDTPPVKGMSNLYGAHTFLLCLEDTSGSSFGIFLMNSNAMEVTLQPAPAITYRTIGGILDFYVFLGNTPEQVVQEYLELVGRPFLPPYWSLGFQLGRRAYGDINKLKTVVSRTRNASVPYDVQYFDIDYMEANKDFTVDETAYPNLSSYVEELHQKGLKSVMIVTPGIFSDISYQPYRDGTEKRIWIIDNSGFVLGKGYPGPTVFPDYSDPICTQWWEDQLNEFYKNLTFDGVWIERDDLFSLPLNSSYTCENNPLNTPPFTPRVVDRILFEKTLCMDTELKLSFHYDLHSVYGYLMAIATDSALKNIFHKNRHFILSRSTFAGSGKYVAHWLGDNAATWDDLQWSIPSILEFNLFGIPLVGANICGYTHDVTEELCTRWMQLGAFYPLSRNYNGPDFRDQDPAAFGNSSLLLNSSKHYLHIRYRLLPYLYTLFYRAHTRGDTVARPLVHEFYQDPATWDVYKQFLWGPGLLITPVLQKDAVQVEAYIPDATWYDYETNESIPWRKQSVKLHLPEDKMGLHLRGGYIFPIQEPSVTTNASRKNSLGLIVALDYKREAKGELFWDDGVSADAVAKKNYILYEFSVSSNRLQATIINNNYSDPHNLTFTDIIILGMDKEPANVTVMHANNNSPKLTVVYNASAKVVNFKIVRGLDLGQEFSISWSLPVKDTEKFNCFPEDPAVSKESCELRGCLWEPTTVAGVPPCFHDTIPSYMASNIQYQPAGISMQLTHLAPPTSARAATPPRSSRSVPPGAAAAAEATSDPFSAKIRLLNVSVIYHTENMLQFKIYDSSYKRYEVPVPLNIPPSPVGSPENRLYDVSIQNNPFGIQIRRKSSNTVIWDSQLPGFTFNDMFLSISTRLPSPYIYGLGENEHETFKRDVNWHTWGMFARHESSAKNSYGVHPYYMALEKDGNAHGVLLLNSNAMDVTLQPLPALTYRTTGGILDFYMVLGPTPELVTQQYTELIGRPAMIPYWALGFQLSHYGYQNDTGISNLYRATIAANIPHDVQHINMDYRDRKLDFTLSPSFQSLSFLIDGMKKNGTKFILVLDPAISGNETAYPTFTRGQENDVFIKWPKSNDIVWGKVGPVLPGVTVDDSLDHETQVKLYRAHVAFPDFLRKSTAAWWKKEIEELYKNPGKPEKSLKFDGLWIDMNEPTNYVNGSVGGCRDEVLNKPPYMPLLESRDRGLSSQTLCMESEQVLPDGSQVRHYDVHSLYGWSQTRPTYEAVQEVTGQRGIIITRSTFPSSGRWGGHWLGDSRARWDQMRKSIIGMMEFSLFGIPYTGADMCGLFGDADNEMCVRWIQLGAFYPLSRSHITIGTKSQHPVAWNSTLETYLKGIIRIRYIMLPYFYTLMHKAHVEGSTVIRPLLHEFTNDNTTWDIDRQFMLGPAILISPVLEHNTFEVNAYFPRARWYDLFREEIVESRGEWKNLSTPLELINLHIRGGHILPLQVSGINTHASRQNFMGLVVALDENETAQGQMFWDDGESIDTYENGKYFLANFTAFKNVLQIHTVHNKYLNESNSLNVRDILIWGINSTSVTQVRVTYNNQQFMETNFCSDPNNQTLSIELTGKNISLEKLTEITWLFGGSTVPATPTSTYSTTGGPSPTTTIEFTLSTVIPNATTNATMPFTTSTATTTPFPTIGPIPTTTTEATTTSTCLYKHSYTFFNKYCHNNSFLNNRSCPITTTEATTTSTVPSASTNATTPFLISTATTTPFPTIGTFSTITTTKATTTSTVPNASTNTPTPFSTSNATTTPFSTIGPVPITTTEATTTSTVPSASTNVTTPFLISTATTTPFPTISTFSTITTTKATTTSTVPNASTNTPTPFSTSTATTTPFSTIGPVPITTTEATTTSTVPSASTNATTPFLISTATTTPFPTIGTFSTITTTKATTTSTVPSASTNTPTPFLTSTATTHFPALNPIPATTTEATTTSTVPSASTNTTTPFLTSTATTPLPTIGPIPTTTTEATTTSTVPSASTNTTTPFLTSTATTPFPTIGPIPTTTTEATTTSTVPSASTNTTTPFLKSTATTPLPTIGPIPTTTTEATTTSTVPSVSTNTTTPFSTSTATTHFPALNPIPATTTEATTTSTVPSASTNTTTPFLTSTATTPLPTIGPIPTTTTEATTTSTVPSASTNTTTPFLTSTATTPLPTIGPIPTTTTEATNYYYTFLKSTATTPLPTIGPIPTTTTEATTTSTVPSVSTNTTTPFSTSTATTHFPALNPIPATTTEATTTSTVPSASTNTTTPFLTSTATTPLPTFGPIPTTTTEATTTSTVPSASTNTTTPFLKSTATTPLPTIGPIPTTTTEATTTSTVPSVSTNTTTPFSTSTATTHFPALNPIPATTTEATTTSTVPSASTNTTTPFLTSTATTPLPTIGPIPTTTTEATTTSTVPSASTNTTTPFLTSTATTPLPTIGPIPTTTTEATTTSTVPSASTNTTTPFLKSTATTPLPTIGPIPTTTTEATTTSTVPSVSTNTTTPFSTSTATTHFPALNPIPATTTEATTTSTVPNASTNTTIPFLTSTATTPLPTIGPIPTTTTEATTTSTVPSASTNTTIPFLTSTATTPLPTIGPIPTTTTKATTTSTVPSASTNTTTPFSTSTATTHFPALNPIPATTTEATTTSTVPSASTNTTTPFLTSTATTPLPTFGPIPTTTTEATTTSTVPSASTNTTTPFLKSTATTPLPTIGPIPTTTTEATTTSTVPSVSTNTTTPFSTSTATTHFPALNPIPATTTEATTTSTVPSASTNTTTPFLTSTATTPLPTIGPIPTTTTEATTTSTVPNASTNTTIPFLTSTATTPLPTIGPIPTTTTEATTTSTVPSASTNTTTPFLTSTATTPLPTIGPIPTTTTEATTTSTVPSVSTNTTTPFSTSTATTHFPALNPIPATTTEATTTSTVPNASTNTTIPFLTSTATTPLPTIGPIPTTTTEATTTSTVPSASTNTTTPFLTSTATTPLPTISPIPTTTTKATTTSTVPSASTYTTTPFLTSTATTPLPTIGPIPTTTTEATTTSTVPSASTNTTTPFLTSTATTPFPTIGPIPTTTTKATTTSTVPSASTKTTTPFLTSTATTPLPTIGPIPTTTTKATTTSTVPTASTYTTTPFSTSTATTTPFPTIGPIPTTTTEATTTFTVPSASTNTPTPFSTSTATTTPFPTIGPIPTTTTKATTTSTVPSTSTSTTTPFSKSTATTTPFSTIRTFSTTTTETLPTSTVPSASSCYYAFFNKYFHNYSFLNNRQYHNKYCHNYSFPNNQSYPNNCYRPPSTHWRRVGTGFVGTVELGTCSCKFSFLPTELVKLQGTAEGVGSYRAHLSGTWVSSNMGNWRWVSTSAPTLPHSNQEGDAKLAGGDPSSSHQQAHRKQEGALNLNAAANLVEQRPRWVLVPRMQAKTLHCTLKDSLYPWMSWYQQDLQGQLELLAALRSDGDEKVTTLPGADYRVKRVSSTELELRVANVTQSRTLLEGCRARGSGAGNSPAPKGAGGAWGREKSCRDPGEPGPGQVLLARGALLLPPILWTPQGRPKEQVAGVQSGGEPVRRRFKGTSAKGVRAGCMWGGEFFPPGGAIGPRFWSCTVGVGETQPPHGAPVFTETQPPL